MIDNKICVKINCYKGFSYDETLNGIKNAGFHYLELSTSKGNSLGLSQDMPFNELWKIKEDINSRGLTPFAIGGNSYIMDDDTSKIVSNIYLARFFGCKYVDTTVFNARNDGEAQTSDEEVINHIKFYIPYLEKYDLTLVIELHGKYASGEALANIIKQVNNSHVRINYDTGNALYCAGLEVDEMLEDLKKNVNDVSFFHLKDKLEAKNVWNFPAIGNGYIPFKDVFTILKENNNYSPLIVEIEFTAKGVSSVKEVDEALIDSANYLKSLNIKI